MHNNSFSFENVYFVCNGFIKFYTSGEVMEGGGRGKGSGGKGRGGKGGGGKGGGGKGSGVMMG